MKKEEDHIREVRTSFAERQPGEFTVTDYRELPNDPRVELIDGVLYVMEILSVSTAKKDIELKLTKYRQAGVREYWIIDLEKEKICVYDFTEDTLPALYGWQDSIPVRIFDGQCTLSMPASVIPDAETSDKND